ncbi:substrate-binding periplasmic protein [Formivibrio citricus]|uniref:substrate-binding periplasmic protein n=1 Tax=Formivibrio citricus TaxID=83765 RepID=UPI0015A6AD66|nr:transporter substrate-binding domain-containing protein [Formivibrio citricus]
MILATQEYPPYIINTDQGAQGLAVDIVRTAFSRIGQPVKFEFYPFARGLNMVLNGEADGFFSIKKTPERESSLLFPKKALINQDYVFFVRKDSKWRFNGSLDSLADARIGVVHATSYGNRFDSAVQAGRFKKLDPASNNTMTFRKLLAGRVDAVICSRLVGLYYLRMLNGLNDVEVSGPPIETTVSYMVFSRHKDYASLSRHFDQAMESMERDGTLEKMFATHQLPQARIPPKRR